MIHDEEHRRVRQKEQLKACAAEAIY